MSLNIASKTSVDISTDMGSRRCGNSRKRCNLTMALVVLLATMFLFSSYSTIQNIGYVPTLSHPAVDTSKDATNSSSTPRSNLTSSFLFSKYDIDFKPTTKLSEKKCDPISGQPPEKIASFESYDHLRNLTELTTIHGDFDTPFAICQFDDQVNHFAHVMQRLYMCYTFWQDNPSRSPVLYIKEHDGRKKMNQIFSKNPFLKGFVQLLTSQMNVEILTHREIVYLIKNDNHGDFVDDKTKNIHDGNETMNFTYSEMKSPIGYVLSHVDMLNELAENRVDFHEGDRNRNTIKYQHRDTQCSAPTIGILNRKPSNRRSILNAESLVGEITSRLFPGSDTMSPSALPVSLAYFEGKTFEQQVNFFQNVDLLISPHGAQLTGLPFLANKKCAKLIELFPPNYLLPDYYGTLAVDSGIEYSYVYISWESPANAMDQKSKRIVGKSKPERVIARKKNMCIDPYRMVDMLRDQIRDWCKCRELSESEF